MDQQLEPDNRDASRSDGFAMLGILALTIVLIVFLAIQVI